MSRVPDGIAYLRAAGTSIVVDARGDAVPQIVHWGADLGPLTAAELAALADDAVTRHGHLDETVRFPILPVESDGWSGVPSIEGYGAGPLLRPYLVGMTGLRFEMADESGLAIVTELLLGEYGVLRMRHSVTNTSKAGYDLAALRCLMPLSGEATELLDLTGRWCGERVPQRRMLTDGVHLRASRRGRTGHDAPLLLVAGTAGFGFRHGEVWACHVAWSGDHEHLVQRLPEGAGVHAGVLGGGELLRTGEITLRPGDVYRTPWTYFVWSNTGLDGLSHRLHRTLRARPQHPRTPRKVVLNSWEAVGFDQHFDRLRDLADAAADLGVERFVVDDGWFRTDDTAGLGDWYVHPKPWPEGLGPLVEHVRNRGMDMGLWVEPEMVNPDSNLARNHPEWILTDGAPLWRHQWALDLANPDAYEHLLERLDSLVSEYHIDFLKWDHNRDLHAAVHVDAKGRWVPGTHAQTTATYRLMDELRRRHPGLEIETCASGGARLDLEMLERTDRVWASDTTDALERQRIHLWTALLVPPELIGTHVSGPTSPSTGRIIDLSFRMLTSVFGHAGIEWDITRCTDYERRKLRDWIAGYRELRALLHSGDVVRTDLPDRDALMYGVVAADQSEALFFYTRLRPGADEAPGRVRFAGLDPDQRYRVTPRTDLGGPRVVDVTEPPGWLASGITLPGATLTRMGLTMPVLYPASGIAVHLRVVRSIDNEGPL